MTDFNLADYLYAAVGRGAQAGNSMLEAMGRAALPYFWGMVGIFAALAVIYFFIASGWPGKVRGYLWT